MRPILGLFGGLCLAGTCLNFQTFTVYQFAAGIGTGLLFLGLMGILHALIEIRDRLLKMDINMWNIGVSQWRELRFPGADHPMPEPELKEYAAQQKGRAQKNSERKTR
jgi:hypothetical protein